MSYLLTFGVDLNWKERLYITISGFPKATVQASTITYCLRVLCEYWVLISTEQHIRIKYPNFLIDTNHYAFAGCFGTGRTRPRSYKKSSAIFWSCQHCVDSKRAGDYTNSTLWSYINGQICTEISTESPYSYNGINYLTKFFLYLFWIITVRIKSNLFCSTRIFWSISFDQCKFSFFKGLHKVLVFLNPFLPFFLFIFYFSFFFIHFRFPQLCSLCSEHWTCSVHAVNINAIFNACICERKKKSPLPTKCSIQNFPNRQ